MSKFSFDNKTVLVTGASSGIGFKICEYLLNNSNCTIIAVSKTQSRLLLAKRNLNNTPRFVTFSSDLSKIKGYNNLVEFIRKQEFNISAMFNCVGILPKFNKFENISIPESVSALECNFNSTLYAINKILPLIKENGKGLMVNITSAAALCPVYGASLYSATKVASQRFLECVALEETDVKIISVMPGFTKTDIMRNQVATESELKFINKISLNANKVAKKIVKKSAKGKKRIIIGFDARFMNFMYKLMPKTAPKIIRWVFKKSNFKLFENAIHNNDNNK